MTLTLSPSRGSVDHYASQSKLGKTLITGRRLCSKNASIILKSAFKTTRIPFSDALRDTRQICSTQDSKSTSAWDCISPSNGSNSSTKGLSWASAMMMAQVLLPTSSRYTLNPLLHQSPLNHSHHGLKLFSWGHLPCTTTLSKLLGSLKIGASKLTYRGSATLTPSLWRLTTKSRNGKHMQQPLHVLASYARVVWKPHMPLTNWGPLRT